MGLKEQSEFKNHVQLEPVSEIRESYVRNGLYEVGEEVVIRDKGIVGKINVLGSNYLIVESKGEKWRVWLDAVEKVDPSFDYFGIMPNSKVQQTTESINEAKQDPDIKDRPGAQPAGYHTGLKKSTKIARDRHFKKYGKKPDDQDSAYKPAPGDKGAKTKTSKHTKKFRQMFGDD
jgi:hypothetical protein